MGKDARVSRWETTTADLEIATGREGGVGLGVDVGGVADGRAGCAGTALTRLLAFRSLPLSARTEFRSIDATTFLP
jgi:hypothetical protein